MIRFGFVVVGVGYTGVMVLGLRGYFSNTSAPSPKSGVERFAFDIEISPIYLSSIPRFFAAGYVRKLQSLKFSPTHPTD